MPVLPVTDLFEGYHLGRAMSPAGLRIRADPLARAYLDRGQ